mmetsp:Transcript_20726/g.33380  ORF Transcript_20726/g.33380 Transcript_20726/m.33380 type:complete len:109 (+) Transcript_20726:250-576(+)
MLEFIFSKLQYSVVSWFYNTLLSVSINVQRTISCGWRWWNEDVPWLGAAETDLGDVGRMTVSTLQSSFDARNIFESDSHWVWNEHGVAPDTSVLHVPMRPSYSLVSTR